MAAMAARSALLVLLLPLARGAFSDWFQAPAASPLAEPEHRRLQYAPLPDGGVYDPNDDSSHYIYPGANTGGYTQPTGFIPNRQGPQAPVTTPIPTPPVSSTKRWRGMVTASFQSDPLDVHASSGSSDSIIEAESSQWSSSYSGSGSGWLWPWAYKNLPWVLPYWRWWQYVMTIVTAIGAGIGACCCVVCFCHILHTQKAPRRKPAHKHHHHHHRNHKDAEEEDEEEEEEYASSESEDLEDPDLEHSSHKKRNQGGSQSSMHRPGNMPTGHQVGLLSHQPPTAGFHAAGYGY